MKLLAAGFLCIFLPLAAGAETVMLYTEEPVGKGDVKKSRGYMEDGIMGAFFDAGHIIFNSHADEDESDGEAAVQELFGDRNSFRAAKAGGAEFLLEIVMEFNDDAEEPLPRSVKYRMYRLGDATLLSQGAVYLRNAGDSEELSGEELLHNMGQTLAQKALSRL
jgi:hypothetical protein